MVFSDCVPLLPAEIEAGPWGTATKVRCTVFSHQGINRQIIRMCSDGGLTMSAARAYRPSGAGSLASGSLHL